MSFSALKRKYIAMSTILVDLIKKIFLHPEKGKFPNAILCFLNSGCG